MPRKKVKAGKKVKAAHRAEAQGSPLSIVILAAGQGSRMLSDLPKVLQPLAGIPLLAHVLEVANSLNPAAIHVVYGYGGERVRDAFRQDHQLQWANQSRQLGTGHAVLQAMPAIPDSHRVLILYGDVPLLRPETLIELIGTARSSDLALLTASLPDPRGYGRIVRAKGGSPQRIVEEADTTRKERAIREINTGVMVVAARLLRNWLVALKPRGERGEYYLTDVLAMAVKQKLRVTTVQAADIEEVQGINDRQQLADAEAQYRRRRARALMAQGVTLIDPLRVDLRGPITVGRDVQLDVNVVIEGPVTLGDGVKIGPNTVISQVTIGAGTVILANCVMQDSQIGKNCRIGPYTRLRPKSRVLDDVHLGNFVEIKASEIGVGSKVNHLTYVGNAEVGSGVNIGAGTVTCNYDGVNKWTTRIGSGAFIGSGAMLVAPVQIGEGATIGAGSTISSDAPAGKLTLARGRQTTIENWERPRKSNK